MEQDSGRRAVNISIRGIVQGVGFRPFVYQLAKKNGLSGRVCNTSGDVKIEAEGSPESIHRFLEDLRPSAPPRSQIDTMDWSDSEPSGYQTFEISESVRKEGEYQLISPDIATCLLCQTELFDPKDRRHRYPFINCTHCGPRLTIIRDIPYDRPMTTMAVFRMCP
ncbi:MAG: acylphosphatase, partial [Pseudomonadota bacterium]